MAERTPELADTKAKDWREALRKVMELADNHTGPFHVYEVSYPGGSFSMGTKAMVFKGGKKR